MSVRNNISLGIIIQARTGSTRLHNKVILEFYQGLSILDLILAKFNDQYFDPYAKILATSTSESDSNLESNCKNSGFEFFSGNESDVLERFIVSGEQFNLTHIVRVCADNPFLNVSNIKVLINQLYEQESLGNQVDYLSFRTDKGVPTIKSHLGLFVEIVSLSALKRVNVATKEQLYHEHVTNYIYEHHNEFDVVLLPAPDTVYNRHDIRLTIDNKDDFTLMANLYARTVLVSENLNDLIRFIDNDVENDYKKIMIDNINKYIK